MGATSDDIYPRLGILFDQYLPLPVVPAVVVRSSISSCVGLESKTGKSGSTHRRPTESPNRRLDMT